jgi:hypothetical protein
MTASARRSQGSAAGFGSLARTPAGVVLAVGASGSAGTATVDEGTVGRGPRLVIRCGGRCRPGACAALEPNHVH